jgi:hypothetical protein
MKSPFDDHDYNGDEPDDDVPWLGIIVAIFIIGIVSFILLTQ